MFAGGLVTSGSGFSACGLWLRFGIEKRTVEAEPLTGDTRRSFQINAVLFSMLDSRNIAFMPASAVRSKLNPLSEKTN
jgi:hypothetical protein